jgi:protein disulfide-isomerase A6
MLFFTIFSRSEYIEITEANKNLIGGERPIFVKFYSPNCGHCKAMAPDFAEASTMSKDVDFGGVDCVAQDKICKDYKIDGYPTIYLFGKGNVTGKEFKDHERSVDGFIDFIEETLTVKIPRPPKYMKDLNPINFGTTINNTKCTFVTFFAPWCGHCKKFLPEAKIAAQAFAPDNATVVIGTMNCEKYRGVCTDNDVQGFPTIKLFKEGQVIPYEGSRTADGVAEFINTHCGTERASNGLLSDKAGLIEEAKELVKEFIKAEDKEAVVEKVKAIKADLYASFMNRVIKNGVEKSKEDLAKMNKILSERKVSFKVLDNIKRRYNVFAQVLGEGIEEEKPAEEPKTEEVPAAEEKPAEL